MLDIGYLEERGFIPSALRMAWVMSGRTDPLAANRSELRHTWRATFFLALAAACVLTIFQLPFPWQLIPFAGMFGCLIAAACGGPAYKESDSQDDFADALEKTCALIGLKPEEIWKYGLHEFRALARSSMKSIACDVVAMEHKQNEDWITARRLALREAHKIFLKLGLADPTYDEIYREAENLVRQIEARTSCAQTGSDFEEPRRGSGLLDLTRETDDTSLVGELLDELHPKGTDTPK